MKSEEIKLSEMLAVWEGPPDCPAPTFPLIHMEIQKAQECRGFIRIEYLVGDFDFVGYPLHGDDIVIDLTGKMIKLGYKRFVIPQFLIKQLSIDELKENLIPLLNYTNDSDLQTEICTSSSIEVIVNKIADRFSW